MNKKLLYNILILIFVIIFLFSTYKIISIFKDYKKGQDTYSQISENVIINETDETSEYSTYKIDFDELSKINSDIIGWIKVDGTYISYPIVQSDNNDYYLNHLFTGEENPSGCIFLDYRNSNDFLDNHSIIYGHNMKDDSMFGQLERFKDKEFYLNNKTMTIISLQNTYVVDIFAGYVTNTQDDIWQIEFNDMEFESWLNNIVEKSYFESEIVPSKNDKIITLATCSVESNDSRFVLVGKIRNVE